MRQKQVQKSEAGQRELTLRNILFGILKKLKKVENYQHKSRRKLHSNFT